MQRFRYPPTESTRCSFPNPTSPCLRPLNSNECNLSRAENIVSVVRKGEKVVAAGLGERITYYFECWRSLWSDIFQTRDIGNKTTRSLMLAARNSGQNINLLSVFSQLLNSTSKSQSFSKRKLFLLTFLTCATIRPSHHFLAHWKWVSWKLLHTSKIYDQAWKHSKVRGRISSKQWDRPSIWVTSVLWIILKQNSCVLRSHIEISTYIVSK